MSIVDELVTLLGLEVDPKAEGTASGFGKILGGVTAAAAAAGAALTAAAGAIGAYAAVQAEAIDKSGKMADAFGINFEAFQELEFAAQKSGAEVEEFRMDLENLSKTLDDNDALKELGINAKDATGQLRSTDEVLMDIAAKFETLSKGEQNKFTDKLGLSPSALKLLQQGGKGLAGLRQEARNLGLVLDETAKVKAARFQSSLLNSRSVVDALGKSIAVGLLPSMSEALDKFTAWIEKNKEFIASKTKQVVEGVGDGFDMFGDAVSYAYEELKKFIGPIGDVNEELDITQAVAIVTAIALGALALATIAATWPYLLLAAAVAIVVLALDDLYSYLNGGDSIIGGWVDKFKEAFPEISGAIDKLFGMLGEATSQVGADLMTALEQIGGFLSDLFLAVVDSVISTLKAIEKLVGGANPFEVLPDMFKEQFDIIFNLAGKYAGKLVDSFKGIFGMGDDGVPAEGAGSSAPSGASANVPAGVVQGGGGGGNQSNTNTFNINGAGDPAAVANEVVKRGGLGQTLQQSSPGLTGPTVG